MTAEKTHDDGHVLLISWGYDMVRVACRLETKDLLGVTVSVKDEHGSHLHDILEDLRRCAGDKIRVQLVMPKVIPTAMHQPMGMAAIVASVFSAVVDNASAITWLVCLEFEGRKLGG